MSDEQHPAISELLDLATANDMKQKQIEFLAKEKQTLWDRIDELATKLKHSEERISKLTEERDSLKRDYHDLWTRMDTDYMKLRQAIGLIVSEAIK